MNPALLLQILAAFQAAITAAPKVVELVKQAKDYFATLFGKELITKDQQDALALAIDAHAQMVAAGIIPQHWQVEPDPS